jgi:prevent-host-death family protein
MTLRGSPISELIGKESTDILEDHPAINAREARLNFSKIVQAARFRNSRVIITDHGEPAAALVPITDVKILDMIDELSTQNRLDVGPIKDLSIEQLRKLILDGDSAQEGRDEQRDESHSG